MDYRRVYESGGCYFFTVVTARRRPLFASASAVSHLRAAFRVVRGRYPFQTQCAVVLPDHLHCIWSLPKDDADFSLRWQLIKSYVSRRMPDDRPVWQPRFWEHLIRDETDLAHHLDYIHFNPVKHGYVQRAQAWPFSSIHRYIADGRYPADWGEYGAPNIPEDIGYE